METKKQKENSFGVWTPFKHVMHHLTVSDVINDERADGFRGRFAHGKQLEGIYNLLKARQLTIQELLQELGSEARRVHNRYGKIRIWALHQESLESCNWMDDLGAPSLELGISSIKRFTAESRFKEYSVILIIT